MSAKYFHKSSILMMIIVFLFLGSLFLSKPVSANVITVNTFADEDEDNEFCSLREAIIAVNTGAAYHGCPGGVGADTILVPAGAYTLDSQLPPVTSAMAIAGDPSAETIVQADKLLGLFINYRIFEVKANGTLTLENLVVRYGRRNNANGGGIFNDGGSLTIKNTVVTQNYSFQHAGGIWNKDGTLIIDEGSVISNNEADFYGGGIYNHGGVVYVLGGSLITGNTTTRFGGGVSNDGVLSVAENSIISGNQSVEIGGGIFNYGPLTIESSSITGNIADRGGGIYNHGSLTIIDSTLSNNRAADKGGAIFQSAIHQVTLDESQIIENQAVIGGGIYNDYSHSSTPLIIRDSTFIGNNASHSSGGMHNTSDGNIIIDHCSFSENSAIYGGGIRNAGILTIINGTDLTANSANQGGGIHNSYVLTVKQSLLTQNEANWASIEHDNYGGGIYNSGWLTVDETTLSGNQAYAHGGGIWNSNSLNVNRSTISGNSVFNFTGGGIYNEIDGNLTISNSTISENSAEYQTSGVGIFNMGALNLWNSTLVGNFGGGIFNGQTTTSMNFANTLIANSLGVNDCFIDDEKLGTNLNNLLTIDGCGNLGTPGLGDTLSPLGFYGGLTQTHALLPGSPAIDAGDLTVCTTDPVDGIDQRGVTRPVGSACDVGAFEYNPVPEVQSSTPADGEQLAGGIASLAVVFNKAVLADGSASAADNPANYLLLAAGLNNEFDTQSCRLGREGDDIQIIVNVAEYDSLTHSVNLTVNDDLALDPGLYRLLVCGTTSITDLYGLKLNYGLQDTAITFRVYERVTAEFDATPTNGFVPLTVAFENQSSGDYEECTWEFGDGSSSVDCENVAHIYLTPGVFSVSLEVSGPGGVDKMTRQDYIIVHFQIFLPLVLK